VTPVTLVILLGLMLLIPSAAIYLLAMRGIERASMVGAERWYTAGMAALLPLAIGLNMALLGALYAAMGWAA
jgi:hypothetical protein